eukprot:2787396-Rhodomonas_salina.1
MSGREGDGQWVRSHGGERVRGCTGARVMGCAGAKNRCRHGIPVSFLAQALVFSTLIVFFSLGAGNIRSGVGL